MPFEKKDVNKYIDIAIPTGIGNIRNYLVSSTGDVTIAIGSKWGTLNEITYRLILNKPLILIRGAGGSVQKIIDTNLFDLKSSNVYIVDSAKEAVDKAFELI